MKRTTLALVLLPLMAGSALVPVLWTGARERREREAPAESVSSPVGAVELVVAPQPAEHPVQREERVDVAPAEAAVRVETLETLETVRPPAALLKSTVFVFRLLDPAWHPLAEREIGIRFEACSGGRTTMSDGQIQSDAGGNGRLVIGAFHSTEGTWTLTAYVRGTELVGRIEGARPLQPGINDGGDVVTWYAPALVEGRVVDSRGEPVASAMVKIVAAGSLIPWRMLASGVDGGFVLHDDPPAGALVLVVEDERHLPSPPIPFRAGTRGLVVVLADGAVIAGSIAYPKDFGASIGLALRCRAADTEKTIHPSRDGSFRFEGLAPGTYDLAIRAQWNEALLEFGDLVVTGTETLHDPRLQHVDFRPAMSAQEQIEKVRRRRVR